MNGKKSKTYLLFLSLTLFFGVALVFLSQWEKQKYKPEKVSAQFESELNSRYIAAAKLAEKFSTGINDDEIVNTYNSLPKVDKTFGLEIYKNNSLIFWNDQAFIDNSRISNIKNNRILYLPNGIYQFYTYKTDNYMIVVSDLIKHTYPYRNNYLSSGFQEIYNVPSTWTISETGAGYPIRSSDGNVLLFLKESSEPYLSASGEILLWLTGFLFILFSSLLLYSTYAKLGFFYTNPFSFLLFAADLLILRIIIYLIHLPDLIYISSLFDPVYYASSQLFPNLGDSLITMFVVLLISIYFFVYSNIYIHKHGINSKIDRYLTILVYFLLPLIYYFSIYFIDSIFINSTFELNFTRIQAFGVQSILGFLLIVFTLSSFIFLSLPLIRHLSSRDNPLKIQIVMLASSGALLFLLSLSGIYSIHPVYLIFLISYVFIANLQIRKNKYFNLSTFIYIIVILTAASGYSHFSNLEEKERNERKLLALRISSDRDNVAEYMYQQMELQMKADLALKSFIDSAYADFRLEQDVKTYIRNNYLKGYWNRYLAQITLCYPDKTLKIKPSDLVIGCSRYFEDIIKDLSEPTQNENLHFISESYDASTYIAAIPFSLPGDSTAGQMKIIIEFYKKYVPKGLGYPELLLDNSATAYTDISGYSYAIFSGKELVKNVGEYNYSEYDALILSDSTDGKFYDRSGYSHLVYKIDNGRSIIISKQKNKLIDKLTPFTYQLTMHVFLLLIAYLIFRLIKPSLHQSPDLKTRLQIMTVLLILFASGIIGLVTVNNIIEQNTKKNKDVLSEKTHSVLIELEHKLSSVDIFDISQQAYLQELLTKFSLIFFSDINLYDPTGTLMASSRKEIFNEGLKSIKMQREAYNELAIKKRTLFIMEEEIGSYSYLSAYIPFRNNENQTTAFINLPYFARQQEIQQEISSFLVTVINIYVILTAFAILVSLLIAGYLTRPLQLIRDRFSKLNLNSGIEKIEYSRNDELGDLINEYNIMVEKLAESAAQLAQSERESAWREMARQVAHEIKNPLTPMKLSIQHLQRAWHDKAPDWPARLERITQTLIQQIDSLSAIASAFSDFAKLPAASNSKIDLTSALRASIALFSTYQHINILFNVPEKACFVFADEKQLSRVFVNLLTNSVQAIPQGKAGNITIQLFSKSGLHHIRITDDGTGMSEEQQNKVFSPNFTTKSSGMGLGLAMVKNIVESAGGSISFKSRQGEGTTFEIVLPEYNAGN